MLKKITALMLGILVLALPLAGCGTALNGGDQVEARTLAQPGQALEDVYYNQVSDEFRASLWDFAGKTSGLALAGGKNENSLYSPMSLYYALGMLEAGSAGGTKTALRNFLETGDAEVGGELQKLYALMTLEDEGIAEQIANAIWIREDLADKEKDGVKKDWLDLLANQFYASAFAVDFSDSKTAEVMSDWVEEQTRGKIRPQIDLGDPDLLLVLMNTVYFKADWEEPFSKDSIILDNFYGSGGVYGEVPYLSRLIIPNKVLVADEFDAASIPLVSGQMKFILPREGLTPEDLLADPDFLLSLSARNWNLARLDLRLPKFSYRDKLDILKAMDPLGLSGIVQGTPDFSAMLDRDAEVSSISQETFIALDEKGVEAAGYTQIMMKDTSAMPQEYEDLVLHLDRPFIFVITDDAGTPLFVGIVRNPLAE